MAESDAVRRPPLELIQEDVEKGLTEFLTPTTGFNRPHPFTDGKPISNDTHTAVIWEYSGVHTKPINGIKPTRREVVVRGVTVVDHSAKVPTLHRYIDWAEVMGQLGLSITGRPAVDDPFET